VVNCFWLATPEGAALFRPTYLGICGGLMFGGALYQPKNRLPIIKLVGWKSRRRLPPIPKRSISPETCQNKRCLHTKKRIIYRSTYSYMCGELLLVGNAGKRCAFPAYIYGYRWWCGVVFGWQRRKALRFSGLQLPNNKIIPLISPTLNIKPVPQFQLAITNIVPMNQIINSTHHMR